MMPGMVLYDIGVQFDNGTVRRDVCISTGEEAAKTLALVDVRMSSGIGTFGKHIGFDVRVVTPSEASK
jgi:hypothetical protein